MCSCWHRSCALVSTETLPATLIRKHCDMLHAPPLPHSPYCSRRILQPPLGVVLQQALDCIAGRLQLPNVAHRKCQSCTIWYPVLYGRGQDCKKTCCSTSAITRNSSAVQATGGNPQPPALPYSPSSPGQLPAAAACCSAAASSGWHSWSSPAARCHMQSAAHAPGAAAAAPPGSSLLGMQRVRAWAAVASRVQDQWHPTSPGTAHTCSGGSGSLLTTSKRSVSCMYCVADHMQVGDVVCGINGTQQAQALSTPAAQDVIGAH